MNHSIADGIALVRVMLSLTDATPTPKPAKRQVESTNHAGPLDWLPGLLDNPARLADLARTGVHGAYRLGRMVLLPPDPPTAFKGELGRRKRAAWSAPLPLEDFKAVGKAFGATVNDVLHNPQSPVSDLDQVDDCLIHTGSKKILDGVCSQLHLDTDSTRVEKSYDVLENFGNLSSASTGFMLAGKKEWAGPAMVVGFGVGFTASAGLMSVN